jgi:hypothetical protein
MTVRAKFRCTKQELNYGTSMKYTFVPQYQPDVPEDQKYEKATPQGELWMVVDNPAVSFTIGQDYYLDLVAVPAPEPAAEA